jgi:HD superfamily phosphohydrolase
VVEGLVPNEREVLLDYAERERSSASVTRLWSIYHKEFPPFLREFAEMPQMQRLKQVGMNCGCEYTDFPRFRGIGPYSRYDHSVGVALIIWHFTGDVRQTLAGLFHDITTPVFAHVVDFLNGDHVRQESTEEGIEEFLRSADEIRRRLRKYGLVPADVSDYHQFPVADNDAPALSADRLEYTLGNLLNYGLADIGDLRRFYHDLVVGTDEQGRPELVFRTPETAADFAAASLKTSVVYVADEDRFAMETLALLLREAIERGVLTRKDLWGTEPEVIAKLEADPACAAMWRRFRECSRILRADERPQDGFWIRVDAKKRWIDPMTLGMGRVSCWNKEICHQQTAFCGQDFSVWLSAE